MAQALKPPSDEIAIQARTIAQELRGKGESFASIAKAVESRLGWRISRQAVSKWFDEDGSIIPVTLRSERIVRMDGDVDAALNVIERVDPHTMDLAWELKKVIAAELTHIHWIQAMAGSTKEKGLRLEIGAFTVPHIRAIANVLASIPAEAVQADQDEDDPMREYLRGFEND